jgi:hypothetical protein
MLLLAELLVREDAVAVQLRELLDLLDLVFHGRRGARGGRRRRGRGDLRILIRFALRSPSRRLPA